ncbi:hypothetical protein ACMD2_17467 [Ananas comosus]|uniref:Uncharacterized protein n=1 Tax=Ananas comosus TaxID=4615 RepID=A0A199VX90_ANACO|nr:hypothetical protein ACMD2_17467 [Ananas comosus]
MARTIIENPTPSAVPTRALLLELFLGTAGLSGCRRAAAQAAVRANAIVAAYGRILAAVHIHHIIYNLRVFTGPLCPSGSNLINCKDAAVLAAGRGISSSGSVNEVEIARLPFRKARRPSGKTARYSDSLGVSFAAERFAVRRMPSASDWPMTSVSVGWSKDCQTEALARSESTKFPASVRLRPATFLLDSAVGVAENQAAAGFGELERGVLADGAAAVGGPDDVRGAGGGVGDVAAAAAVAVDDEYGEQEGVAIGGAEEAAGEGGAESGRVGAEKYGANSDIGVRAHITYGVGMGKGIVVDPGGGEIGCPVPEGRLLGAEGTQLGKEQGGEEEEEEEEDAMGKSHGRHRSCPF